MNQPNEQTFSSSNILLKKIWRLKETVEFLGISKGHLYNLTSRNEIPHIKKGKLLYFVPQDVENWVLEGNS